MKISDRDKKLLYVVLAALIVFCAWFFGYRKLTALNSKLTDEIKALKIEQNNLEIIKRKIPQYEEDTAFYKAEYDRMLAKYDTGYSQEYSLMFIKEIEDKVDVWMSQAGLAQTENVYTFGKISSSNPNGGGSVYVTDYKGYKTTLTLTYQATYEHFKDLIEYINSYKYKCTIDTMSMSFNSDTGIVSGGITVTQYAITGSDREFGNVTINDVIPGTDNIFESSIFTPGISADTENGSYILSDYDYYVTLQSAQSDLDSVIIGAKNDVTGSSTIASNANKSQDMTIRFSGDAESNYYVEYSVGDVKYSKTLFIPGEKLTMLVISSDRIAEDDLAGVDATIINETDRQLAIKIVNEDNGSPRFVIRDTTGDIAVYN